MIRNKCFLFIFCFLIHTLVFAFFPRKHKVDRLPHAQINEYFNNNEASAAGLEATAQTELIEDLLFQIIELSQEFSDLGQGNFHLLLNGYYKNLGALAVAVYLKIRFLFFTPAFLAQQASGVYAHNVPLLPDYYSFLFRLTPF